jgi:hypothetical protein
MSSVIFQNFSSDVFTISMMNHTISDVQKYSSLSSAAIKSSGWTIWGGGGRSGWKESLRWWMILSTTG